MKRKFNKLQGEFQLTRLNNFTTFTFSRLTLNVALSLFRTCTLINASALLKPTGTTTRTTTTKLKVLLNALRIGNVNKELNAFIGSGPTYIITVLTKLRLRMTLFLILRILKPLQLMADVPIFDAHANTMTSQRNSLNVALSVLLNLFRLAQNQNAMEILKRQSADIPFRLFITAATVGFLVSNTTTNQTDPILFRSRVDTLLLILKLLGMLISLKNRNITFLAATKLILTLGRQDDF